MRSKMDSSDCLRNTRSMKIDRGERLYMVDLHKNPQLMLIHGMVSSMQQTPLG